LGEPGPQEAPAGGFRGGLRVPLSASIPFMSSTNAPHQVIPADVCDAMVNEHPQLVGPVAIALDRSPDRQVWALAAAQPTADGRARTPGVRSPDRYVRTVLRSRPV